MIWKRTLVRIPRERGDPVVLRKKPDEVRQNLLGAPWIPAVAHPGEGQDGEREDLCLRFQRADRAKAAESLGAFPATPKRCRLAAWNTLAYR